MASNASFDVSTGADLQEVDNAVNQALKEIAQRYDFKGTGAQIRWSGEYGVEIEANSEERAKAVLDVFKEKLVKRGVSLKHLESGDPRQSGKDYRIQGTFEDGISTENAKKVAKIVRDEGPKGVKVQVQGDELRVASKKKDDLQQVITMLKGKDLDVALQFINFR
jgi:cyclic-di-GMP-binding protein